MYVHAGKRQTLSPEEFSTNLKLFFGKISDQEVHHVDTAQLFKEALKSLKGYDKEKREGMWVEAAMGV